MAGILIFTEIKTKHKAFQRTVICSDKCTVIISNNPVLTKFKLMYLKFSFLASLALNHETKAHRDIFVQLGEKVINNIKGLIPFCY